MESPLSKALKVVSGRKEKPTIRVCGCGTPLIWTFCFAYKERYCLNCGVATPMFDGNEDREVTRELIFKKKLVDAIWKVLNGNKGLIPRSRYQKGGCKKCSVRKENHNEHLSPAEIEWDKIATKYLGKFEGIFNED